MKCGVMRFLGAVLLLSAILCSSLSAQITRKVPAAIKYQVVLRDVNGAVLSDRANVDIRVSLRQGVPTGTVVYQEEHIGLKTNAYGLIHLEIGTGNNIGGVATLHEVPWGEDALYAQIEVQTDGTGYTQMGVSELLTVPYAFFAGNADNVGMKFNLKDGEVPMYNASDEELTASGIVQKGDRIYISSPSNPDGGYTLPTTKGGKNQVLMVKDASGDLVWGYVESGGPGEGGKLRFDLSDNGRFLFWDADNDTVRPAPFVYDAKTGEFRAMGEFYAEGEFHAMENLIAEKKLITDDLDAWLPRAQIFVGDASNRSKAQPVSGHIALDENGKTELNLVYINGLGIKAGTAGNKDTLFINSALLGGDSLWLQSETNRNVMYAHNKGRALTDTKVGIGTDNAREALQVEGGNVLFSNQTGTDSTVFYWNAASGALRVGGISEVEMERETTYPAYSMGFGKAVRVMAPHSFAFGENATVNPDADYSFVFGKESRTFASQSFVMGNEAEVGYTGTNGIAIGNEAEVNAPNALAIGNTAIAAGSNSISIGKNNQIRGENSFAFGVDNTSSKEKALVIGNGNDAGNNGIAIGSTNTVEDGAIAIGRGLNAGDGDIIIGYEENLADKSIVVGSVKRTGDNNASGPRISIGTNNVNGDNDVVMLGRWLDNEDLDYEQLVMLGYHTGTNEVERDLSMDEDPVFVFGVNGPLMGIAEYGNAYFKGDVTANGWRSPSDFRLKDNIRPVTYPLTLTDSLQPVSYYLKSDKSKQQRLGFIAQEVQRHFPCLVREGGKGMLSLDYMGLIPVLWDFSKQLHQENMELKKEVSEQAARIDKLEAEIKAIKELLNQDK